MGADDAIGADDDLEVGAAEFGDGDAGNVALSVTAAWFLLFLFGQGGLRKDPTGDDEDREEDAEGEVHRFRVAEKLTRNLRSVLTKVPRIMRIAGGNSGEKPTFSQYRSRPRGRGGGRGDFGGVGCGGG